MEYETLKINIMENFKQSKEQKMAMYMKLSKDEIAEMLIKSNEHVDSLIKNCNLPVVTNRTLSLRDLDVNDLFAMNYGYSKCEFRVKDVFEEGLSAHMLSWCKSSAIYIPFNNGREIQKTGKISRWRAFWLI